MYRCGQCQDQSDYRRRCAEAQPCVALGFLGCVSICIPAAPLQCKRAGGDDFFGFFMTLWTLNFLGVHFYKLFGYSAFFALKFINRHVLHPTKLYFCLYINDELIIVKTIMKSCIMSY